MTDYRAIVRHVRYWRGTVHRWSTSYRFTGSLTAPLDPTAASTLLLADDKMCYSSSSGAVAGGTYACEIYAASGGTPLASYTRFDWETPASWIPYAATAWGSRTPAQDAVAETAALVEWPAGLSRTGKPVKFRKFYHAVPDTSGPGSSPDIPTATQATLAAQANNVSICLYSGYGIALGSAGRLPGTPVVLPFYVTHQMPRGRRKKVVPAKQADAQYSEILQLLESEAYKQANA